LSAVDIAQLAHTMTSAFSAVRDSDALFPNDFGEDLLLFLIFIILEIST